MAHEWHTLTDDTEVTTFVIADSYIVGVGDTLDDLQASGEWLSAEKTVVVRP